ncbi:MAG TPA: hypothetical protein VFQ48_11095, partial [Pseudonocardiaceae bacterium]|nr:hypothetical protein [Pseudonocardiaceae bacterium]
AVALVLTVRLRLQRQVGSQGPLGQQRVQQGRERAGRQRAGTAGLGDDRGERALTAVTRTASTASTASRPVMTCTSARCTGWTVILAARPKKGRPYDCSASITDMSLFDQPGHLVDHRDAGGVVRDRDSQRPQGLVPVPCL